LTIVSSPSLPLRDDYTIAPQRSVLASIREPAVSFAIWRRSLAPELTAAIGGWIERATLAADLTLAADEPLGLALPALSQLPDAGIAGDIERLFADFRSLSGARRVRLTLGVKRSDACRKFHADYVQLRLITTYFGPGTEWVPSYAIDREVLADPPLCPREANRRIVRDRRAVRHARAGDVLLLKGERHGKARAAVHRSPPIAARGLVRLVLTLTTAD
jgi:hypothetical protein